MNASLNDVLMNVSLNGSSLSDVYHLVVVVGVVNDVVSDVVSDGVYVIDFDLTYLFYIIEYEKKIKRTENFLYKLKKMNDLKNNLKNFNELNSKIQSIENTLNSLKEERTSLENNILSILENNNLTDKDIRFGDTKFQYHISEKKDTFTQQFIKNNLMSFFKEVQNQSNENATKNTDYLFQYLLSKRATKKNKNLKLIKINKTNQ
jgi:hypothetical protein